MDRDIWLLAGYAGSGKTTAGMILKDTLPHSFETSFAKEVKNQVAELYDLDRTMLDTQEGKATFVESEQKTARQLLVEYSALCKQNTHCPGIWAEYVVDEINKNPHIQHWIIHDWRYFAEVQTIRYFLPFARIHTLRIVNEQVHPTMCSSERELDYAVVDHIIPNNGSIEDLTRALTHIYRK